MSQYPKQKILLLMSGSIACVKATSLISEWSRRGDLVRVACTSSVRQFVGRATLEGLGAEQVFDDVFTPDRAMDHIHLARWADVIIACPATSNLINRLAAGIADDAVTTLWQVAHGTGRPMVLIPAMNTHMWNYPATVESVARLKSWGVHVPPTAEGSLACGEHGAGRMLEPAEIMAVVDKLFAGPASVPVRKVLITAGGTREPIDSVRYIGNISSGRTAAMLTDALVAAGNEVTWLGATDAVRPEACCDMHSFNTFGDLDQQLQHLLGTLHFDVVIHAAAVSDFSVASVETLESGTISPVRGKLLSGAGLRIHLQPYPKLLDRLPAYAVNKDIRVIGFKLTHYEDQAERVKAVEQLLASGVDAVVHNDLLEISDQRHPFLVYTHDGEPMSCEDSGALADCIDGMLKKVS